MQSARILLILAAAIAGAAAKDKAPKPPEVEVVEMSLHRETGIITVDTTVRNLSGKPIRGFTAIYHFYGPGHAPITTQQTKIDEPVLDTGAESAIHAQLEEPPRAIEVEFSAVDTGGWELRIKNPGPFPIE